MYTVNVKIEGIATLLQHRFPMPNFNDLGKVVKTTGSKDYSTEWREYLYVNHEGIIYQPANHIKAAMVKAAMNFKVAGKRGKSYKDLFKGSVFVSPDAISHGIKAPQTLDTDETKPLYLDMRPVVIQSSRIVRIRPAFSPCWQLNFDIQVLDDEVALNVCEDVLILAGNTVGIGDNRPENGRFRIVSFERNR